MLDYLDLYIGCSFTGFLFLFAGRRLFKAKERVNKIQLVFYIFITGILATLFNVYATDTLTSVVRIVLSYMLSWLYYYFVFKVTMSKSITVGFLTYLSVIIADIVFGIITAILEVIFNINSMIIHDNKILVNLLIYLIAFIIIRINEKKFIDLTESSDFNKKISTIMTVVVMLTTALLGFKLPLSEWKLSVDFILTMAITLCSCSIGIFILKQKSTIRKTSLKYQQLVDYSDITNGLLEDYRVVSHEHKNQLSIIRGMIDNSNKELSDYLDDLLDKRNVIKYQWIGELNRLPLSGLKGLINYKIMEMEKHELNITIMISKEVANTKLNNLTSKQKDNLYSIIGIYLDNAIQAAKESEKKEISLEIYKEKYELVFILANSYKGEINLEKLDDYGFTTKGKNHGVGLHIVRKILEDEKCYKQSRKLFEDYFVQELRINLKEIKKH